MRLRKNAASLAEGRLRYQMSIGVFRGYVTSACTVAPQTCEECQLPEFELTGIQGARNEPLLRKPL
jgi:hypothetical protein